MWSYNESSPHLPNGAPTPLPPLHWSHISANLELSSSILTNDPQESGSSFVWPLRYWTTASHELLAAVVTWNVRPRTLLQWNLSWVKGICVISSSTAVFLRNVLFSRQLLIPWYEVSSFTCGKDGLPITKFDTRSQPPGKKLHLACITFC